MREFELVIDEALKKGLAPKSMVPANTQLLSECIGFRCGAFGLEAAPLGNNALANAVSLDYSWPFPQLLQGERFNILVVRDDFEMADKVYNLSNDLSNITHIFDIDESTFGKGSLMELADFGEYAFMTNGVVMIYGGPLYWSAVTSNPKIPMMRTVCNFKGQAVGGCILSNWHDCNETFYVWSKIGSMDFTPDQDNEAGYRRDPFGGEVYHVRRIGEHVLGYSSCGITQMSPVSSPTTTFGFSEVLDHGLVNRGAVGGSLQEQVFVDNNYELWRIALEYGAMGSARAVPQRLGYRKFLKSLEGEDILVLYDRVKSDYYIGNSRKTYLLTRYGLTEVAQHPSIVYRKGGDESLVMAPDTVDDVKPTITTETFDMGYRGLKTVFEMETDALLHSGPEAAVNYSYDANSWGYGSFTPFNKLGIASMIVSGNYFRFRIRFDTLFSGFRVSYIRARYKMNDLRGLRGVYAPPPRGQ